MRGSGYKIWIFLAWAAGGFLTLRYVMPLALPFLVGFGVAWAAEPVAGRLCRKGSFPRGVATGIAIGGVYALLLGLLYLLGRLALGELDHLGRQLPHMVEGLDETADRVYGWLDSLIKKAPAHLQPGLRESLQELFSSGSALAEGAVSRVLGLASRILVSLPDTFVFLGTAVVSSFLISAQLPRFRPWLEGKLPESWKCKIQPVLQNLWRNLKNWLRAQCKLMGLTFTLLTVGFFILRVPKALLIGALTALVDALPMLGTGTVLVPWGLIVLLRGNTALGLGLISLYVLTALLRSVMEPRIMGRQLGLNPLVTLAALYAGYHLWGILGMLLAPVLTITLLEFWSMTRNVAKDG